MPLSNNPGAFLDVAEVLDAAKEAGGARYRLDSERAAIRWRSRAYHYRSLLFRRSEVAGKPYGLPPTTPYDELVLRLEGPDVVITFGEGMKGALTGLDGRRLEPLRKARDEEDNELMNLALNIAKEKGDD